MDIPKCCLQSYEKAVQTQKHNNSDVECGMYLWFIYADGSTLFKSRRLLLTNHLAKPRLELQAATLMLLIELPN